MLNLSFNAVVLYSIESHLHYTAPEEGGSIQKVDGGPKESFWFFVKVGIEKNVLSY